MSSFSTRSNAGNRQPWVFKCTDVPQFDALQAQAWLMQSDDKLHLRNLCNDSARCAGLTSCLVSRGNRKMILDYSRQRVTGETMELLFDLADAVQLNQRILRMQLGMRINRTMAAPVLHHVLRMPLHVPWEIRDPQHTLLSNKLHPKDDGAAIVRNLHLARDKYNELVFRIRNESALSVTGAPFRNVLLVSHGPFCLGPQLVLDALAANDRAQKSCRGRILRIVSNVDPTHFWQQTHDLNAAETLVVMVAPLMVQAEIMLNVRTALHWLCQELGHDNGRVGPTETEILGKHFVAVTHNEVRAHQFGIKKDHVVALPEWVEPRFSLFSAAGMFPLSLHLGTDLMAELMDGAHDMDQHFFHGPLRDNLPVILGLIGVWNSTFLGYSSRIVLPYSDALRSFTPWLQNVEMESNGKRVALDGTSLLHKSSEVVLGATGTSCHAIAQLLHQGRVVPADFIGFMVSQTPTDLPEEAVSNHDELMSHFFAQPDALAYGKTHNDLLQEGAPEPLREHMVVPGNRPSSSLLLTQLDAFGLGQLIALYEHRTAVQGFVWGLNSFDNFGNDLGKSMAKNLRAQISASRKAGASVQGFNSSTTYLLEQYLAQDK